MKKQNRRKILIFGFFVLFMAGNVFAQGQPEIDSGATAWMLTSTALVLLMIPGLAMFYGGLVRTKNVLGTMMHSFSAMGIMTVMWVTVGYSMCFGGNVFGGNVFGGIGIMCYYLALIPILWKVVFRNMYFLCFRENLLSSLQRL